MRKPIIIILFTLVQISAWSQIKIGPKVGMTFSQQNIESDYLIWKTGFEFGVLANVSLTEQLYLQSEFLVTQKGFKEEFGDDELFNQLTATYWQLPVTVQYRRGFELEYYGSLGFYVGRWQSGKLKSRIEEGGQIIEEDYEFTSSYNIEGFKDNRTDFGAIVSAGIIYPLSINHIMLDVRYNHGLTDVNDLQTEPEGYSKQNNQNLVVSLTLLFYL